jgi:hypothetical protein
MAREIIGEKKLDRKLAKLGDKVSGNVALAGTRKSVQVLAKAMKRAIPARFKEARKGVGWKATKGRAASSRNKEQAAVAKAGVKVGRKKAQIEALGKAQADSRKSAGLRGVGIGANNFQWWIKGTKSRSGPRGSMPAKMPGFAASVATANKGAMKAASVIAMKKKLQTEVAKLK